MSRLRPLVVSFLRVTGLRRVMNLSSRIKEIEVSAAENSRLNAALAPRLGELEQIVADLALRRVERDT